MINFDRAIDADERPGGRSLPAIFLQRWLRRSGSGCCLWAS